MVQSAPRFLGHGFGSVSVRILCVKRAIFFLPKFYHYFACQKKNCKHTSITGVLNNITLFIQVNSY